MGASPARAETGTRAVSIIRRREQRTGRAAAGRGVGLPPEHPEKLGHIAEEDLGAGAAAHCESPQRPSSGMNKPGCSPCDPPVDPSYFQIKPFQALNRAVPDPTTLILVDEAGRLHMNSLEGIRSIFDDGGIGMVLSGMPYREEGRSLSSIPFTERLRPRLPSAGRSPDDDTAERRVVAGRRESF